MRRKRPFGTIFAVLAPAVLCVACGRAPAAAPPPVPQPPRIVAIEFSDVEGSLREPHVRYPLGTKLVLEHEDGRQTPLFPGLAAVGEPEPTLDGERMLFPAKADPAEKYGIWSCRLDGTDLRREVDVNADCGRAAELPDGRLVYSRAVPGTPVAGLRSAWALYVKAPGERDGQRITFGAGLAIDPTVVSDGRILYSAWQPVGGSWLWTVHPDGTGAQRVPGGAEDPTAFPLLPYQAESGDVVFGAFFEHYQFGEIRHPAPRVLDWRAPGRPLRAADDWPPRRASRPQGHLSMVRASVPYGTLVGLDAGEGARRIRFSVLEDTGAGPPSHLLGEVTLAEDRSFFVRVPTDVPLVLETLGADGQVLGGQETPFWVRPNETRACVGCHDDSQKAPPNERPLAVLRDPVDLSGKDGR